MLKPAINMSLRILNCVISFVLACLASIGAAAPLTVEEYRLLKADAELLTGLVDRIETEKIQASPAFMSYREAYSNYVNSLNAKTSSRHELAKRLGEARLVLFGDSHANSRSQENLTWVMEQMTAGTRILVVEWIERKYQKALDGFMAEKLTAAELREAIRFDESWGFSWNSHLPILETARRLGFQVIAAENKYGQSGSARIPLRTRDNHVTEAVSDIFAATNDARVVVAYGEMHLNGNKDGHLAEKLSAAGLRPDLVVFPQVTSAYWENLSQTLDPEKSEVLQFSDSEFYLDQGVLLKPWTMVNYYFKLLNLHSQHLNFVKSKLSAQTVETLNSSACLAALF